jgi:hypothetical protein
MFSEFGRDDRTRSVPGWVRVVVWVSAAFLTMSVILGMFLY